MNRRVGIKELLLALHSLFAALAGIATPSEPHEGIAAAPRRSRTSKLRCPLCGGPCAEMR